MHRFFGIQAGRGSPKIAVLDTIHGANIIAQRMADLGLDSQALEVYHSSPSVSKFDLIVAPIHLWSGNHTIAEARRLGKTIISHHQAVGELMEPFIRIFEVTGTHSKTSTALLLAKMLSSCFKTVSHTTRGLEAWSKGKNSMIEQGMSITPGNVIRAVDAAESRGSEALVCEISLGGVGLGDYGIITSFSGDYKIAKCTKWASTAKLQMLSLAKEKACILTNTDVRIASDITFGNGGFVRVERDKIIIGESAHSLDLDEELDFGGYQTALAGSTAAAHAAGFDGFEIVGSLEGFDGIEGRMKVVRDGRLEIFDYSNSGLKVSDVDRALDIVSGSELALVVGEEAETVCEGMNIQALVDLIKQRRDEINFLVVVGERLIPWEKELRASIAHDLASGTELARVQHGINKLLLCVKCFR
ncbi:MAG: coenzyme F430 synthase [Methanotrichaceae archaeon]|nr:coenzyme F430 synthase [Methanotrichaceae archaeon]